MKDDLYGTAVIPATRVISAAFAARVSRGARLAATHKDFEEPVRLFEVRWNVR